jgi:hypothetical protein
MDIRIQSVKLANNFEIIGINNAIISLDAKITAGIANNNITAIQQTAVFWTTVGQTESIGGE